MGKTSLANSTFRRSVSAGAVALLFTISACGGSSSEDTPDTTPTDDTVLVKNMPLNECTSVMSGERPAPGVTIPRCTPKSVPKRK